MNGALPPSSSDTFLIVAAHCAISSLPTSVDPVNEILRTDGIRRQLAADLGRRAGDDVEHARGDAGALASTASASAENGVCDAGLATTVQPAASAGPTLRVIIAIGKFHGVMQPTTPIGSLITMMRLSRACDGNRVAVGALGFFAEPLDERRAVGDLAARFGERLALLERHQPGEIFLVRHDEVEPAAQDGRALFARSRAPFGQRGGRVIDGRARLGPARLGTEPMTSPVAGSSTGMVAPLAAAIQ